MATKFATLLYKGYRQTEAEDAAVLLDVAITIFVGYPEEVVRGACHPSRGLPVKCQFPPQAFDISKECESRMKVLRDAAAHAQREADRRREADAGPAALTDEEKAERRDFIARWRENQALGAARADDAIGGVRLHDLDSRKCQGEMKVLVEKACEAHTSRLIAEFKANPPMASMALLVKEGIDPLGRGMGNGLRRELNDDLPI